MSWHRSVAVVALMMVPMFAADTGAIAAQLTSASSTDAAWLATQLHQTHFSSRPERSFDSLSYDRANASTMPDGPHTNGFHSDGGASRVLPVAERFRGTNPTGFSRAWCAIFANMILTRTGSDLTGSGALVRTIWPTGVRACTRRDRRVAASCRICRELRRPRADSCRQRQS